MEEEELAEFSSLSDDAGEISKHDLIVQTKKSSFWKGNLDLKSKPSGHSTKVCWNHWILTKTNIETFFQDHIIRNRDLFSEKPKPKPSINWLNSVLTFPSNIHRHTCNYLSSVKRYNSKNGVHGVKSVNSGTVYRQFIAWCYYETIFSETKTVTFY